METLASVQIHTSIVSSKTVCIAFTLAVLNDLQMKANFLQNAYGTAPCAEKDMPFWGLKFQRA